MALGVLLPAVVALIWWAAQQQSTVNRKPADTVLVPVMPPPPPPPPPLEQPKPEEVPPEELPPVPVEQPQPLPPQPAPPAPASNAAPSAAAPAAPGNAVSISGPAQAGGDAFNIAAGSGGGARGAGGTGGGRGLARFNSAAYASYLAGELTRAIRSDNELRNQPLRVRVRLWIDAGGRITRVEPLDTDKAARIRTVLAGRTVRAPDASLSMPVLLTLNIARGG